MTMPPNSAGADYAWQFPLRVFGWRKSPAAWLSLVVRLHVPSTTFHKIKAPRNFSRGVWCWQIYFSRADAGEFLERGCARSVSRSHMKIAAAGLRHSRAPFKSGHRPLCRRQKEEPPRGFPRGGFMFSEFNFYAPTLASSSLVSTFTILNCSACIPVSARKDSLPK